MWNTCNIVFTQYPLRSLQAQLHSAANEVEQVRYHTYGLLPLSFKLLPYLWPAIPTFQVATIPMACYPCLSSCYHTYGLLPLPFKLLPYLRPATPTFQVATIPTGCYPCLPSCYHTYGLLPLPFKLLPYLWPATPAFYAASTMVAVHAIALRRPWPAIPVCRVVRESISRPV